MNNYRFGNWHFDNISGELKQGDKIVRLEPTVSRLLIYFLEHQNKLITRDELMENVWQGRIVSDDTINRAISLMRQALNTPNKNSIIKTIPKRGYTAQFPETDTIEQHSDVQHQNVTSSNTQSDNQTFLDHKARNKIVFLSIFGILIVTAIFIGMQQKGSVTNTKNNPVIAVLKFVDNSENENNNHIGSAISESIISMLSKQRNLRVVARTSSFSINQTEQSISNISEVLNAEFILEGSTQVFGTELRINARLIDVESETPIWSSTFYRLKEDIFSIQDDIAQSTLVAILGSLTKIDNPPYQPSFPAYQQVMLGQQSSSLHTKGGLQKAKEHYELAITLDPNYALAHVLLAKTLNQLNQISPVTQQYSGLLFSQQKIENLLIHAISLEPSLSEAYSLRGKIYLQENALDKAETSLQRSISLNPNNAEAYADLAKLNRRNNQIEQGIIFARKAVTLNPQDNQLNQLLAILLWRNGRAEEAVSVIKHIADIHPNAANNNSLLSRWYLQMGKGFEAMQYAVKEWELEPNNPDRHWGVCLMHVQIWDESSALKCIDTLLNSHPDYFEAKNWKTMILSENETSIDLSLKQIEEFPQARYYKLQLAQKINLAGNFKDTLSLLEPIYPELLTSTFEINARNIWGAWMLSHALMETEQVSQGNKVLNAILDFIAQSRVLKNGGYTTGVDDVVVHAILGNIDRAIEILEERVSNNWIFYSYAFFAMPATKELAQDARFQMIKKQLQETMKIEQSKVKAQLGANIGY